MQVKNVLLFVLLIWVQSLLGQQTAQNYFAGTAYENGLFYGIDQDQLGNIWTITTVNSAKKVLKLKPDGSVTEYNSTNTPGLPWQFWSYARNLKVGPNNRIWICKVEDGATNLPFYIFDTNMTLLSTSAASTLDAISAFDFDAQGNLWFCAVQPPNNYNQKILSLPSALVAQGLFQESSLTAYEGPAIPVLPTDPFSNAIATAPNGDIWFSDNYEGIFKKSGSNWSQEYPAGVIFMDMKFRENGDFYFGSYLNGLVYQENGTTKQVFPDDIISALALDFNNTTWFFNASGSGIAMFYKMNFGGAPEEFTLVDGYYPDVEEVFCDRDNNVWVTTDYGLLLIGAPPPPPVIVTSPKLTLSDADWYPGEGITIQGSGYYPSNFATVTISGPGGFTATETINTDAGGAFSHFFQAPLNAPTGTFSIAGLDVFTQKTAGITAFYTQTTAPVMTILRPLESTRVYASVNQQLEVSWQDQVIPGPSGLTYQYTVEYKKLSASSWTVASANVTGLHTGSGFYQVHHAIDLSQETLLSNPEKYVVRVTDNLHPTRMAISAPFDVLDSPSNEGISFRWDYSYSQAPSTPPTGVAADSVARIYADITGLSNVQQVTLTLFDGENPAVAMEPTELGSVMVAGVNDHFSSEANNASEITASAFTAGLTDYHFWYVAPADFVRAGAAAADAQKSERFVRLVFTIYYAGGGTETREEVVKIVRPPVFFQHGLNSDHYTWDNFNAASNGVNVLDQPIFTLTHANEVSPNAYFLDNATILLGLQYGNAYTKSIPQVIGEMRQLGYACNRVDYVGHSMGGCMARLMTNQPEYRSNRNYNRGYINRMITINTPHHGSPMADLIYKAGESGAIDASIGFLQTVTMLVAEGILKQVPVGGELIYKISEPFIEDAFLRAVAELASGLLKYDPTTEHFSACAAVRDLQIRNNTASGADPGVALPASQVNAHFIAGDSPCLFDRYTKEFNKWLCFWNIPGSQTMLETADAFCDINEQLMNFAGDTYDFANHSDYIVSTKSQLAGNASVNTLTQDIFANASHCCFAAPILENGSAADKVLELLNSRFEDQRFMTEISATPEYGFSPPADDRNPVFTSMRDTGIIKIVAPQLQSQINALSDVSLWVNLKDTANLISAGAIFQGEFRDLPKEQRLFNLQIKTNGLLGHQTILAVAYFKTANGTLEVWDSVGVRVMPVGTPTRLIAEPNLLILEPAQVETFVLKAIQPQGLVVIPIQDPGVSVQIMTPGIISFNTHGRKITGLSDGITGLIVQWKGQKDTIFVQVKNAPMVVSESEPKAPISQTLLSRAFPNPTSDAVTVEVETPKVCLLRVNLWNCLGKRVYTAQQKSQIAGIQSFGIDMQSLAPGIYFLEISNDNETITKRIVKE